MTKHFFQFIALLHINRISKNKSFKTKICKKAYELINVLIKLNIILKLEKIQNEYVIYFNKNTNFKIKLYNKEIKSRKKKINNNFTKYKTIFIINTTSGLSITTDNTTKHPI